jgi:hypothetical protein
LPCILRSMSGLRRDLASLVHELRPALIAFGQREGVSLLEMVSLLGAAVLSIGIRLEEAAHLEERAKTFQVPLASELLDVIVQFGQRHQVDPVEMIAVLGAALIDTGVSIESRRNPRTYVN